MAIAKEQSMAPRARDASGEEMNERMGRVLKLAELKNVAEYISIICYHWLAASVYGYWKMSALIRSTL